MEASPSVEQSRVLAALEQAHGQVHRLEDQGEGIVEQILSRCVTDTRVYACEHCLGVFSIEPDGEVTSWDVRLHRLDEEEE